MRYEPDYTEEDCEAWNSVPSQAWKVYRDHEALDYWAMLTRTLEQNS